MPHSLTNDHNHQEKLFTLWVFILLNILFRDIHEFFRIGVIEEIISGYSNGTELTEELLLVGGLIVEVPLLMLVISRFAHRKLNRWCNLIAAPLALILLAFSDHQDLDDLFFAFFQGVGLLGIIGYAFFWKVDDPSLTHAEQLETLGNN